MTKGLDMAIATKRGEAGPPARPPSRKEGRQGLELAEGMAARKIHEGILPYQNSKR
jgi:hypothetical protein